MVSTSSDAPTEVAPERGIIRRMIDRRSVRYALRVIGTAVVVSLLVHFIGWDGIVLAITTASVPLLILMYVVGLLRQFVDSVQLAFVMRRVGLDVGTPRAFLASQLSSFYALMVPGEIAASAAKWANLSALTGRRSLVLNALAYNNLLLVGAPLLLGTVALAIANPLGTRWGLVFPLFAIAAVLALMILLYSRRLGSRSDRLLRRLIGAAPGRISEKGTYVLDSMEKVRSLDWRVHVTMVGLTFVGLAVGVLRFYIAMRALGIVVPLVSVVWIMAFLKFARLLPITIANLGIREGLLVFALSASNVPAEHAVALGLLGFSVIVLNALIGAGYQIALVMGWVSAAPTEFQEGAVDA